MGSARILVVERDEDILKHCQDALSALPETEIVFQKNGKSAIDELGTERSFDLLIADENAQTNEGVRLFRQARRKDPNLPLLILSDGATAKTAVECMKLGAADYLIKPFMPEEFLVTVRHLLQSKRLREEYRTLQWQSVRAHSFDSIVGRSPAMRHVFKTIHLVSETDVDVLIVGETGT